jgi:hypothetical protein
MVHAVKKALLLVSLAALAVAPSCGGTSAPQTDQFVGNWTFASGELTPVCPGVAGVMPFSIAGGPVTLTKLDATTLSLVLNPQCDVHLAVSGSRATVLPAQTCTLDVGGASGSQVISITTWTLVLSGDHIDNTIAGSVVICTASGTGVLVRDTSDAGAND